MTRQDEIEARRILARYRALIRQAASLERWLTRLVATHAERIVPVDNRVAEQWGRLAAMRTGSVIDTLMAATAVVHDLVLVTRNVKDVSWTGASYLDPFVPSL